MKNNSLRLQFAGGFVLGYLASISTVQAQIVPDNTLPVNSKVTPGCVVCTIEGGTVRGVNLFHSFRQFSIPTGGEAYFNNAAQIQNILGRVTGTSLSNIDGLIRANGAANLYLLNPNGFVFGPNARLQIGGSFTATTADSVKFPGGGEFNAVNPQAPPLLAVSVTPGVQYGVRPSSSTISNAGNLAVPAGQSITLLGGTTTSTGTLTAPGGTVQVLGDRVALQDNAHIDVSSPTRGGTVLVGGDYRGQGTVSNATQTYVGPNAAISANATTTGNGGKVIVWADGNTRFYGAIDARGGSVNGDGGSVEVSGKQNLVYQGIVNASATNGRPGTLLLDPTNIEVVAGNGNGALTNVSDRTLPDIGFVNDQGLPVPGTQINAALLDGANQNVVLDASNNITFSAPITITTPGVGLSAIAGNSIFVNNNISTNLGNISLTANSKVTIRNSRIFSSLENARGAGAGDITINANSLLVEGSEISSSTFGNWNGGSINVNVGNDAVLRGSPNRITSIKSNVEEGSIGNAGKLTITAKSLSVTDGALIETRTRGNGDGGPITINVSGLASFDGSRVGGGFRSGVFSGVEAPKGNGQGGTITITAGSLVMQGGASLSSSTSGTGNAGSVKLTIAGAATLDGSFTGVFSTVEKTGVGDAGDIDLTAGSLKLTGGAKLSSVVTEGTGTTKRASAGSIILTVTNEASFDGFDVGRNSGVFTSLDDPQTVGSAGKIDLTAGSLKLTRGAQISSSTAGIGDAGNVKINVTGAATFDGSGGGYRSGVFSTVQDTGVGTAGGIDLTAGSLKLLRSAELSASTFGTRSTVQPSNANLVRINIAGDASFDGNGSGIFSLSGNGVNGSAGGIDIKATSLSLTNQAQINVDNQGTGIGGNINITVPGKITLDNATLTARTFSTEKSGNITIDPDILLLRHGSKIITSAGNGSPADGGNIDITAGFVVGVRSENSDIVANAFKGAGGNITINANGVFGFLQVPSGNLETPFSDIAASSQFGLSGTIILNTLNIDPSQGLAELNLAPEDSSKLVAQGCASGKRVVLGQDKFIITGRSGLSASPDDVFRGARILTELGSPSSTPATQTSSLSNAASNSTPPTNTLVEAQGWVVGPNGKIRLVAQSPNLAPDSNPRPSTCLDQSNPVRL